MGQIEHNDYTALVAIIETMANVTPTMKIEDAWDHIKSIEALTRAHSGSALTSGLTTVAGTSAHSGPAPASDASIHIGQWIKHSTYADDIRDSIHAGKKINAIKDLRATTLYGLKESKEGVEWYERTYM